MTVMLPAHLTETLDSLGGAARALADEVRVDRIQRDLAAAQTLKTQRKQNQRMINMLVVVALLVAVLVTLSVANRQLGMANAKLNKQNSQIVERIESCTTIGEQCYEEGAARTQTAITQLMQVDIAVARCSKTATTDAELEACVRKYMAVQPSASPSTGAPDSPAP